MNGLAKDLPKWFFIARDGARRAVEKHPDGDLELATLRQIWRLMYEESMHAHFRRGLTYFIGGCGILSVWGADPHVSEERRALFLAALEAARVVLLDEQGLANRNRDLVNLQAHAEAESECVALGYAASVLHYINLPPLLEDLAPEAPLADLPDPEWLACMFYTNYPSRDNDFEAATVRRYWQWWLDCVLATAALPIGQCLELVRSINLLTDDLRHFAFDCRR